MQFEVLPTQLRNMRRKLKQKQRNFEIIEILKRRNIEPAQNEATQTGVLV